LLSFSSCFFPKLPKLCSYSYFFPKTPWLWPSSS
jgi:hypothetical protein